MRIHIIGGPGSGKTPLALKLTKALHIPSYELDSIWCNEQTITDRSLAKILHYIDDIATQAEWITEGTDITCTNQLLLQANYIIWLDIPWPLALWHIVTRYVRTSIQKTNRYPGIFRLLQFVKDSILYYTSSNKHNNQYTRLYTAHLLSNFEGKTLQCTSYKNLQAVLKIILADISTHKGIIPENTPSQSEQLPPSQIRYRVTVNSLTGNS